MESISCSYDVLIAQSLKKLDDICFIRDWQFSNDKYDLIGRLVLEITDLLGQLSAEEVEKNKALLAFIRGKAINSLESFSSEAEDLLTLSVKLDPLNSDAWTSLGNCLWKKGDKELAKNCLIESINQRKNKEALCELSIMLRQIKTDKSTVEESLKLAKQAIELDLNDHKSWYIYGNALCASYFYVSFGIKDLQKSLHAYRQSEKLGGSCNPDLFFNKGNVHLYLQEYNHAISCFLRAYSIDPTLTAAREAIQETQQLHNKVTEIIQSGGGIRQKRKEELRTLLETASASLPTSARFSTLRPGDNAGATLLLRSIVPVSKGNTPPAVFLCLDADGSFGLLSLFNFGMDASQFTSSQTLAIRNPHLRSVASDIPTSPTASAPPSSLASPPMDPVVDTSNPVIEEKKDEDHAEEADSRSVHLLFIDVPIVQLFDLSLFRVDGQALSQSSIAPPTLQLTTF